MTVNTKSSILYVALGAVIVIIFFYLFQIASSATIVPIVLDILAFLLIIIAIVTLTKEGLVGLFKNNSHIEPSPSPRSKGEKGNAIHQPNKNNPPQSTYADRTYPKKDKRSK